MKFKVGDSVRCIDFNGSTGRTLREMPQVLTVAGAYSKEGEQFLLVGEKALPAYSYRFVLAGSISGDQAADEYDEIMLADKLVNG